MGHTVDSVSSVGSIAAEYSSEEAYYENLNKPLRDWKHARSSQPAAKLILLASARSCGPKMRTRLIRLAACAHRHLRITLEIYDATRIAEYLVEHLLVDEIRIEQLGEHLAPLRRIRDELAWSNLVPAVSADYLPRPLLEQNLAQRLLRDRVLAIAGLGGQGKSALAAAIVQHCRGAFDMTVWLPAAAIAEIGQLQAVDSDRSGRRINALAWLKSRRCLMVVDDLAATAPSESFKEQCGPGSAVLITRRFVAAGDFQLPTLSEDESMRLLNQHCPTACPAEIFRDIWSVVGGHPLALRLLNLRARIEDNPWTEVRKDCEFVAEMPDDTKTQRIAERVLARVITVLPTELRFFHWCGSSRVDRSFARLAIGSIGLSKLSEFGLESSDRGDAVRLHDIVFTSLKLVAACPESQAAAFELKVDQYTEGLCTGTDDFAFFNFLGLHRNRLESSARSHGYRGGVLYCLLHVWAPEELPIDQIEDPIARISSLTADQTPVSDVDAITIVETIEALYRVHRGKLSLDQAKTWLTTCIPPMTDLAGACGLTSSTRSRIRHHIAKALRLTDQSDDAIKLCRELLAGGHPTPATRILLARLLLERTEGGTEAGELLQGILDEAIGTSQGIEVTVALAAFADLCRPELKTEFESAWDKYGPHVTLWIVESALRGRDHAYAAFAAVGRHLHWKRPEAFNAIFSRLPPRAAADVSVSERASWGSILISASKIAGDAEKSRAYLREGILFLDAVPSPNAFVRKEKAKAFILLGIFPEAEAILLGIATPGAFDLFELAKAQEGMGKSEAYATATRALALLTSDQIRYRSAFLELRATIGQRLGQPDWTQDLREAHQLCEDRRYKEQLRKKLEEHGLTATAS